jgi:non-heme chloroperoxidase
MICFGLSVGLRGIARSPYADERYYMPLVLSSDGLRIHFEASGSGAPVLLLHPNHATAKSWIDLGWFDALASWGFRAVALDARGFGDSDDPTSAQQLAPGTSSADIAAALDLLELGAVHVCGYSLGAAAAIRFAYDLPARVKSLVLGGLGVGPLVQMGLFIGSSADDSRHRALAQLAGLRQSTDRTARYFTFVRESIECVVLERLDAARLRAPMLGIAGAGDAQKPAELYELLRELAVSIQVRELSGAGHGACFADSRFREEAVNFLASSQVSAK